MEPPRTAEYDKTIAMFSPEGRIFQVEYSKNAVRRGAPALGIRAKDGAVLAGVKRRHDRLLEDYDKIVMIDEHIGAVGAGYMSDSRVLMDAARNIAQRYRLTYGEKIKLEFLARRLSSIMQQYTQFGGTRPFGCALIFGGVDAEGAKLMLIDTSGAAISYMATAIGENEDKATEYLKEKYRRDMSTNEAIRLAMQTLIKITDKLSPDQVEIAVIEEKKERLRKLTPGEVEKIWREASTV
ncbi:MAG: archaeal proteasome endopeptidase complex subunit alpha [Candidatus Freyarchaeota archaeon]|nr:archaeal proteasome endopeptidase complex subunit alpha [Candidatus Freyrarchaeum guaymaensis]